ncbi:MAG: MBL fold metallo-hydrolase, partial [Pseudobdellovibrio sp.]
NFEPLIEAGVLQFTDGDTQNFLPNISLIVANGHTQGHQVVHVHDDQQQLFYCGDVIATSSHIRSAWVMGYDLNPLVVIQEKVELLKKTETKKSYLFFEHDPYCDLSTVEKNNDDYKALERFHLT